MTDVKTPRIPISKIDVEEGFNARTHMDEKSSKGSLRALAPLASFSRFRFARERAAASRSLRGIVASPQLSKRV